MAVDEKEETSPCHNHPDLANCCSYRELVRGGRRLSPSPRVVPAPVKGVVEAGTTSEGNYHHPGRPGSPFSA